MPAAALPASAGTCLPPALAGGLLVKTHSNFQPALAGFCPGFSIGSAADFMEVVAAHLAAVVFDPGMNLRFKAGVSKPLLFLVCQFMWRQISWKM